MNLEQLQGFVFALTAMTLYGLYMVPRKKSRASHSSFSAWMGAGILVSAVALGAVSEGVPSVTATQYFIILCSGIVWGTGTSGYCRAVQLIGLSRSTPIKNLSAMFGTLLGVLVLKEFSLTEWAPLVLVLAGSTSVVLSTNLLSRAELPIDGPAAKPDRRTVYIGFAWAFWAAVAFSIYTVPLKIMYSQGISPSGFLFVMGQGGFLGMLAPLMLGSKNVQAGGVEMRDRLLALLSGLMWSLGALCANIAVKHIGVAVTWPLTKTTLVAAAFGALVLREVDMKRHRTDLVLGVTLSVLGVALLAFATAGR